MIIGMISSQAINVGSKSGKPAPEKDPSPRSYQLIHHSVEVCVDLLPHVINEIIQKDNVIVRLERIKEALIAFISGNVDGISFSQLSAGDAVNFVPTNSSIFFVRFEET